jgi:transcriptional regulator with XRE-family HTH domain
MAHYVNPSIIPVVIRARMALGLSQRQLGEMFGTSLRTATRMEAGQSTPRASQLIQLAQAVFPRDASLAATLVAEADTSLEALGLVASAGVPPPSAPVPPARPFPPIALLLDSIMAAAVDATDGQTEPVPRDTVRAVLHAAFARARALGLTIEEIDDVLSLPHATKEKPAAKK